MAEDATRRVLEQITEHGVTELLVELVKRASVVGTPSQCPDFVANKLSHIGMRVETYTLQDFRTGTVVIGHLDGKNERPALMLEGHWDTHLVDPSKWTPNPFGGEIIDGYIYGRGVVDSKGALTAQIAAVEAIQKAGIKLNGSLRLLSIGDGEDGFRGGDLMVDAGIADRTDWVISGEATNLRTIDVAHSGMTICKLDVFGKASHPAQPRHGINAIYKMNKIVADLEQDKVKFRYQPYKYFPDFPRIHVHGIRAQPKGGEVADECSLLFWVLSVPGMTPQSALEDIAQHIEELKKEDKELNYHLKVLPRNWCFWRPPSEVSADEPVVKALQKATESITGNKPELAGFYGIYDTGAVLMTHASHGELFGRPAAVTFGPGEFRMAHTTDEHLATKELADCARIYALTVLELLS